MRTSLSSAITKLQALRVIDLIIVALAAGGYYYVQSLPPPIREAEFQVTNLIVDPIEAGVGQPIIISVNVTNVGARATPYSELVDVGTHTPLRCQIPLKLRQPYTNSVIGEMELQVRRER